MKQQFDFLLTEHPDVQSAGDRIEALAERGTQHFTQFPGGQMRWHEWGAGTPLILFHGGFGSWRHWYRNIENLASEYRVFAADTPGLGESDTLQGDVNPDTLGDAVSSGIKQLLGDEPLHMAAFSFGGVVAGATALRLGDQTRSLTLCGASGMGLRREKFMLVRRTDDMSEQERFDATVENLKRLMLHNHADVTPEAIYIHWLNDNMARLRSRRMSMADSLKNALAELGPSGVKLNGIWGDADVTAMPWIEERKTMLKDYCPTSRFTSINNAGHWVSFEAPEQFDSTLKDYLTAA